MASVPKLPWRVATLIGIWSIIFGTIIAVTPFHMEGGYDVVQEKLGAALCSPILGLMSLTFFLGDSLRSLIVAVLFILGPTTLMLFRCRSRYAFWTIAGAHALVVTVSSVAYFRLSELTLNFGSPP